MRIYSQSLQENWTIQKKKIKDGLSKPNKKTFFFFNLFGLDLAQPYELDWI
jgi:hypothetical protein